MASRKSKERAGADETGGTTLPAKDDPTSRIAREIEKEYGEGVLVSGERFAEAPRESVSWSPSIDSMLCGPIEEGSWVGVTGPPKCGKSSSCLHFAANAQREEWGGRPVFYGKAEGRLSLTMLRGIKGLDLSEGRFNVIQSCEGRVLTAQDHLTIYSSVLRSVPGCVLIIDSISSLCEEKEMNEGVGAESRGGGAKLFSQFCRLMSNVVPINRSVVLGITHLISNTSGFGAALVERAARAWQYQCDYQLRVTGKRPWENTSGRQMGLLIDWQCLTSKNGPPGRKATGHLRFGLGLDETYEVLEMGVGGGKVRTAGSYYHLDFLLASEEGASYLKDGKPPHAQGMEKLYGLFKDDAVLRRLLLESMGMAA